MELLEIRNNLVKLSYKEDETPILGRFTALTSENKSYVAQFVNLKSDVNGSFAIAKLLFTFTNDGIVDAYDGSVPPMNSEISFLPANELLDLLAIDTPLKIGKLSQQEDLVNLDISIFENNFCVFAEHDYERKTFITNCVRQLFQMKEKSVVIDIDDTFEPYPRLKLGQDFKLPLGINMIDYIFNYDLSSVDASTKAVIQDIFYDVQQYIKTLDDGFLPIDNFIEVVASQYKESQMPELALLKNKLLKYRDANIFANTKEEFSILKEKIERKNAIIIDLKDANNELQKAVITYIHRVLDSIDKYIYLFVPLNDDNSDKKLLKLLINHSHVFTTIFSNHIYKYALELKDFAQNIMFFAPLTMQHDFASYNTFLNKLNPGEAIIYGKLTQGIPLIVDIENLELDLTTDDVFGDAVRFVPSQDEEIDISEVPSDNEPAEEIKNEIPITIAEPVMPAEPVVEKFNQIPVLKPKDEIVEEVKSQELIENVTAPKIEQQTNDKVENILEPDEIIEPEEELDSEEFDEDQLNEFSDENSDDELTLTEDDLDFMENNQNFEDYSDTISELQEEPYLEESEDTPMVPIYDTDEGYQESDGEDIGYEKGDKVTHPKFGNGVVEKILKYGNRTLCSINFENVGTRVLDPSVSEFERL